MKEEIYDDLFEEKELEGYAFQIHHPVALVHRLCYFLSGMRLALFEDHYSRVQHKCVHDYQGQ